jgi:hypothetical protein
MSQKVERRLEEFQECTSNVAIGAAPSTIGPSSNHVYLWKTTYKISHIVEQLQKLLKYPLKDPHFGRLINGTWCSHIMFQLFSLFISLLCIFDYNKIYINHVYLVDKPHHEVVMASICLTIPNLKMN